MIGEASKRGKVHGKSIKLSIDSRSENEVQKASNSGSAGGDSFLERAESRGELGRRAGRHGGAVM